MMAIHIANALAENNIESHICVTRKEGVLKPKINDNVNYFFLEKINAIDFKAIYKFREYIKKNEIQIIHAHSSSFFIASMVKLLNSKVKIIWHDHYGDLERIGSRKMQPLKFFSKRFNTIIAVNQNLKKWSEKNLKSKNVVYIPNFAVLSEEKQVTTLGGNNGKRIICLAAFRPQKNHINLLVAFNAAIEKDDDWTLHLVGNHSRDDYFKSIKGFIIDNGLEERVFLYHNVIDVKYILEQSTIGVLSSKSEGLPVSLLEYGLVGLPVVVTNVGACSSVLGEGKNGVLVQPSNSDQLSNALIKLIQSKQLRNTYANNLQKEVLKKYSKKEIIKKIIEIYIS